jgi:endonuclease/exonuclease/phosphatase family metal-dependent hydrolase
MEQVVDSGVVPVATLNLWRQSGAWDKRKAVLINGFRQPQPNIVALHEVVKTDGYDQVADLLGPEFRVAHHGGQSEDGTGAAIASRWPLGELLEADLHVTPRVDPANGWIGRVAAAEVLAPDPVGPLLFVHHKPSWQRGFERERELQAVAAARFVEELLGESGTHVVLAGDFDATPHAASVRFWQGRQSLGGASVCYRDAWESTHPGESGHTFTPRNLLVAGGEMPLELGRRIDYLMVRCEDHGPTLDVSSCERIFDEPLEGVWASDHFGVVADLSSQIPCGRPVQCSLLLLLFIHRSAWKWNSANFALTEF